MARARRRRKKPRRASLFYTVGTAGLIVGVIFVALTLYGLFSPPPTKENTATILVLNGCGVEGAGLKTARLLRELGYDVVDFRNADSFGYRETIVIDRAGDLDSAVEIARILKTANIIQQIQERPFVDVEIIVGRNYERFAGAH